MSAIYKNRKHQRSSEKKYLYWFKYQFWYQYHSSVASIKEIMKLKNISSFSFQHVSIDKVKDIIKNLNTKRACSDRNIPVKLLKMNEKSFQD